MLNLTVDGRRLEGKTTLRNWAQLLEFLEGRDELPARVVTAVRFGGVDEPTFRQTDVLARALPETTPIEVETATADELLAISARTARESLAPLRAVAHRVARAFHDGQLSGAHHDLADFVSALRRLATLTGKLAAARSQSLQRQFFTDGFFNQLCDAVRVLIEREQWEDWAGVSDILEHDMEMLLNRWSAILLSLGDGQTLAERLAMCDGAMSGAASPASGFSRMSRTALNRSATDLAKLEGLEAAS